MKKMTSSLLMLLIAAFHNASAMDASDKPLGSNYSKKRLQELGTIYRSALSEIEWVLEHYPLIQARAELPDDDGGKESTARIRIEVNRESSILPADIPKDLGHASEDHPGFRITEETSQTANEEALGEEFEKASAPLSLEEAQQNLKTARQNFEGENWWLQDLFKEMKGTERQSLQHKLSYWEVFYDVANAKQQFLEAADEVAQKNHESNTLNSEEPSDIQDLRTQLKNAEHYLQEELKIQKPTLLQVNAIDEIKKFMAPSPGRELTNKAIKKALKFFILYALWEPIGTIHSSILTEIKRQNLKILLEDPQNLKGKVDLGLRLTRTREEKFGYGSTREVAIYPSPERIERAISLLRETLKVRRAQYLEDHQLDKTKESLEKYKKYMGSQWLWTAGSISVFSDQKILDAAIEADNLWEQHNRDSDYNLNINNVDRAQALLDLKEDNLINLSSDEQIKDAVTKRWIDKVVEVRQAAQKSGDYKDFREKIKEKINGQI